MAPAASKPLAKKDGQAATLKRPAVACKRPAAAAPASKRPAESVAAAARKRPAAASGTNSVTAKPSIDQDYLSTIMDNMLAKLPPSDVKTLKDNLKYCESLPMASGCTGSNISAAVTAALFEKLKVGVYIDVFTCEKDLSEQ